VPVTFVFGEFEIGQAEGAMRSPLRVGSSQHIGYQVITKIRARPCSGTTCNIAAAKQGQFGSAGCRRHRDTGAGTACLPCRDGWKRRRTALRQRTCSRTRPSSRCRATPKEKPCSLGGVTAGLRIRCASFVVFLAQVWPALTCHELANLGILTHPTGASPHPPEPSIRRYSRP
jgi:hypothetical protein